SDRPPERRVQQRPRPAEGEACDRRTERILQRTRRKPRQEREDERNQRAPTGVAGPRRQESLRPGSRRQREERHQRDPLAKGRGEHRQSARTEGESRPERRTGLLCRANLVQRAGMAEREPGTKDRERKTPQSPPQCRLAHCRGGVEEPRPIALAAALRRILRGAAQQTLDRARRRDAE